MVLIRKREGVGTQARACNALRYSIEHMNRINNVLEVELWKDENGMYFLIYYVYYYSFSIVLT